ncbi:MAG: histone deacetylase [Chlamydiota bacterium]
MNSIPSTFIVTDEQYPSHMTGRGHPECPGRHTSIDEALLENGLLKSDNKLTPRPATKEELSLCHPLEYVNLVEDEVKAANLWGYATLSTGDVRICPKSYSIAKLAVGGVLTGVDHVMQRIGNRVFCNVRPPGHHACKEIGMGFCLFNNVAVGARYAQKVYGVDRVLIVDWDVHHGNGTQNIFYHDPSVFYFSTHQKDIYPNTGYEDEIGKGEGKGKTLNVPIPGEKDSRLEVLKAFEEQLFPAMKSFEPQLVIISAGFDAHEDDPIGGFDLKTQDFYTLTSMVCEIADQYCDGKIVSVLEGGYNLTAIAESVVAHVRAL